MKDTGKTKHYAIHNVSHERLILLCLENPEDKGTTIAVPYDTLDPDTRAELIAFTDSAEGQSVKELYTVLKKKIFQEHPKVSALTYLLNAGKAKKYNISDVTLYYAANKYIALSELITQIHGYEANKFNKKEENLFSDVASNTAPTNEFKNVEAPVVPEPAPVKQDSNEMLASVLMKMTEKLEEISAKLDSNKTTEVVKEEVKTKKK